MLKKRRIITLAILLSITAIIFWQYTERTRYKRLYSSYLKGVEYGTQGQFKKAEKEFKKALKAYYFYAPARDALQITKDVINQKIENNTAIYLFNGITYLVKENLDKALTELDQAITLNPSYAIIYFYRGEVYVGKDQYNQAFTDFDKAIQLQPSYAEIYFNRGAAYRRREQYNQAITDFKKTVQLKPNYAAAYYSLGDIYVKLKNYQKAKTYFEKAVQINPRFAEAYYNLGIIYNNSSDNKKAIKYFQKAKKLFIRQKKFEAAFETLRKLNQLEKK